MTDALLALFLLALGLSFVGLAIRSRTKYPTTVRDYKFARRRKF